MKGQPLTVRGASTTATRREEQRIALCERLRTKLPEVEEVIIARLRQPNFGPSVQGEPDLERGQQETVRACIGLALLAIEEDAKWADVPIPASAVIQVQRVARLGLSLQAVLERYTAGFDVLWDVFLEEVDGAELLEPDRAALLRSASRQLALTVGKVIPLVAAKHAEATTISGRPKKVRIAAVVDALLNSAVVSTDDLDYEVEGHHVAIVGAGNDAEAAVRRLAASSGRPSLIVPRPDGMVWAWIQASELSDQELHNASRPTLDGVRLAIGERGSGKSGFRASHRQAQDAMHVALYQHDFITRYADVIILVPAVKERDRGDSLISIYLTPLEEARERNPSLKETLKAYFAAETNVSAAAARLGVDRHTAATRLREIEKRLGSLIHIRHAELEMALRLDAIRRREADALPGLS